MPTDEVLESGEFDDEELEEVEERLEIDYQIGEDIKERVRILLYISRPTFKSAPHLLTPTFDLRSSLVLSTTLLARH